MNKGIVKILKPTPKNQPKDSESELQSASTQTQEPILLEELFEAERKAAKSAGESTLSRELRRRMEDSIRQTLPESLDVVAEPPLIDISEKC
ncbi:MAG: hypothetical protein PUP92_30835 [Rhizonema sp. PD38]|nr:hypothetical protein [Rhizonema sp. PD38]